MKKILMVIALFLIMSATYADGNSGRGKGYYCVLQKSDFLYIYTSWMRGKKYPYITLVREVFLSRYKYPLDILAPVTITESDKKFITLADLGEDGHFSANIRQVTNEEGTHYKGLLDINLPELEIEVNQLNTYCWKIERDPDYL